jgi:hypothetical protein
MRLSARDRLGQPAIYALQPSAAAAYSAFATTPILRYYPRSLMPCVTNDTLPSPVRICLPHRTHLADAIAGLVLAVRKRCNGRSAIQEGGSELGKLASVDTPVPQQGLCLRHTGLIASRAAMPLQ